MFSKVKENCIAVVTRLNMADGNKTASTRRLQINAASNRKTALFQHRKQIKKKRKEHKFTEQLGNVTQS